MNLLSLNNLIRLGALIGLIASIAAVFSTGDYFYLLFVIIAILAIGSTYFNNKLEYKISKPKITISKLPKRAISIISRNFIWIFCGTIIFLYLFLYTNQGAIASIEGFVKEKLSLHSFFDKALEVSDDGAPTPIPTSTPYPTVVQPTRATYVDPNPIITCNVSANCGGGTRQLRKNVCDNSTCCQIGDSWLFYEDKDKCIVDQNAYVSSNNNQQSGGSSDLVPVFLSYYGISFYCPPQNVDAAKSINSTMESKKSQWASDYNTCYKNATETDSCYQTCTNIRENERNACSNANYADCSLQASDNWLSCTSNCPSLTEKCDWVYTESNSLSKQLNNLCK